MATKSISFETIIQIDRENIDPKALGAYDRFDPQKDYYNALTPTEKLLYEDAVITLCQRYNVDAANLGLYIAGELADLFSKDWKGRVTALLNELIGRGLQPGYRNTTTFAILALILDIEIYALLPFTMEYMQEVTTQLKAGQISQSDWETSYLQCTTILLKMSSDDFSIEFYSFHQDQELQGLLQEKVYGIIYVWMYRGAAFHGIEWLRQMVLKYSNSSDPFLRKEVKKSIRDATGSLKFDDYSERQEKTASFLEWLDTTIV